MISITSSIVREALGFEYSVVADLAESSFIGLEYHSPADRSEVAAESRKTTFSNLVTCELASCSSQTQISGIRKGRHLLRSSQPVDQSVPVSQACFSPVSPW